MEEILLAVMITMMASVAQGIAGFGGGLISMGILSTLWPITMATATMSPLGFILNLTLIWKLKSHIQMNPIKPLLFGIPVGVIIGVMSLELLSDVLLKGILGFALLIAVLNVLWGRTLGSLPRYVGWLSGVFAGITGAALSAPGPPILIYATFSGWARDHFRAQLSMVFLVASTLSLIGLSIRGILTIETLSMSACLIPGVILGSVIGVRLGNLIPQKQFRLLVVLLLTTLAFKFLWGVFTTYS